MRIKLSILLAICIICTFLPVNTLFAEVVGDWTISKVSGDLYGLDLISDGGTLFLVGKEGNIGTSSDGLKWEKQDSTVSKDLYGITKGNKGLVAVGTGVIVASADSKKWEEVKSGTGGILYSVIWAGNKYVAVGEKGAILVSEDGRAWKKQLSGTTKDLFGVTYGNKLFVATGSSGTILTSPDGVKWTDKSLKSDACLVSAAFGGGTFVAITRSQNYFVSSDGSTWVGKKFNQEIYPVKVAWTGKNFTVIGYHLSAVSQNGTEWTISKGNAFKYYAQGVAFCNNRYYAVSDGGTLYSSNDGLNWDQILIGRYETLGINCCAWGAGRYVAVNQNGIFLTSPDGSHWNIVDTGIEDNFRGIAWGADRFVTVGDQGTIYTSSDGVKWEKRISGTESTINSVEYHNGIFVAVAGDGGIISSSDGIKWTIRKQGTEDGSFSLVKIRWLNGKFFAVGYGGRILSSKDGIVWEEVVESSRSDEDDLWTLAYGGGKYIAAGHSVKISADGHKWEDNNIEGISDEGITWDIIYVGDRFYLSSTEGIYKSKDGINWTKDLDWTFDNFVEAPDKLLIYSTGGYFTTKPLINPVNKLKDIFGNCLVMKTGSSKTLLNGAEAYVDSKNTAVSPVVKNQRTLVPIRFISESFGASVEWDAASSTATIKAGDKTAVLTVGQKEMTVNGTSMELDSPAEIINGRTFIPLRALCENVLGKKVFYGDGLIVIGDNEKIPGLMDDKPLVDSLLGLF